MLKTFLFLISLLVSSLSFAQDFKSLITTPVSIKEITPCKLSKASLPNRIRKEESTDTIQFIFDPEGEERMYVMSLYSYDQKNSKFVNAQSLKSQVRFASDGKTIYFKDITKSLGVETWLQGTISGDTISIPFGQPLAYYKGAYLIFFCPMTFEDATGNCTPQDDFKLVMKGDSLVCPQDYPIGSFQAATGYVYISDATQGFLSLDLDHGMAQLKQTITALPSDVKPIDYVYTFTNSYSNVFKKKSKVATKGSDIYMQLSTSAPDAYIHGTIIGDSIDIICPQPITDETFIYFWSLADPIYKDGELTDFIPSVNTKKFALNPTSHSITSSPDVFGVDYIDGMELCMDYITDPHLDIYAGDTPAKPATPILSSIFLEGFGSYISFNLPALDVDSAYINPENITYRLYFDDELYTFEPDVYKNISTPTTDIPYYYQDKYDFFVYSQLHYVYLYEELFTTIGVQAIYTAGRVSTPSDILLYNAETQEQSVVSSIESLTPHLSSLVLNQSYNILGQRVSPTTKGIIIRGGKKMLNR